MSDRIKKIKIKQADGTFSDYIPIGANAKDIDLQYNGSNVENTLKKKPYYYDSVAAMKLDDTLKEGDMAITLGYYEANDGGGAEYEIGNFSEEDALNYEGGMIHTLVSNLKAKIIIYGGKINVDQFGAKGDGITDDTEAIQNAINALSANFNYAKAFNNNVIEITSASYIITSTITMPVYIKLKPVGAVLFLSKVNDGACLRVTSGNTQILTYNSLISYYDQSYIQGGVVDGSCGTLILQKLNTSTTQYYDVNNETDSIGLEIGDTTYNANNIRVSRFVMKNISIHQFTVGLKINANNTYITKFENCYIQRNRYNFVFGNENIDANNSGENLTFERCVFGLGYTAFKLHNSCDLHLYGCSCDFHGCLIDIESYEGSRISFHGGHIEGVGITNTNILTTENNTTGYGCICYNNISYGIGLTRLNFFGTDFYMVSSSNNKINKFVSTQNMENRVHLSVGLYGIELTKDTENLMNCFLTVSKDVEIINYDNRMQGGSPKYLSSPHSDYMGKLEHIPTNRTNNDTMNNNDGYQIDVPGGISSHSELLTALSINITDKIFNKSISAEFENCAYLQLKRRIDAPPKNKIAFVAYFKPVGIAGDEDTLDNYSYLFTCRSYNNNDIATNTARTISATSSSLVLDEETGWYRTLIYIDSIPTGSAYLKITFTVQFKNSSNSNINCSGKMLFGGLITEYFD